MSAQQIVSNTGNPACTLGQNKTIIHWNKAATRALWGCHGKYSRFVISEGQ